MAAKKILIPLDGSYKEFNKYKQAFAGTALWNQLTFLIDDDLNKDVFKDSNCIQIDTSGIEYDIEACEKILKKCGYEGNFDGFCVVEFYQNRTKYNSAEAHRRECAKKLICIHTVLEELAYDYVIYNLVSHFFPRAIQLISKAIGKPVYGYTQSLVPGKEYIWLDDELHSSTELKRLIEESEGGDIASQDVMEQVVSRKRDKTYMAVFGRSFLQELTSLYAIRSRLKPSTFTRSRLLFFIEKCFLRKIKAVLWKQQAVKKIPDKKFVFFPLHMPGEAQTLIRGYPFVNDVEVLYQLSLIVPSNIQIVAKEHPGYEGWKSVYELDLVKRMPNVTLVRSTISSHDLIEQSEFVVTINSSVWFESFAFCKPVVTLGSGVFSGFDVTHEVDSFAELRAAIRGLLSNEEVMKIPQTRVEKFVHCYSEMSSTGELYRYTKSENQNFAHLISNKVKSLEVSFV